MVFDPSDVISMVWYTRICAGGCIVQPVSRMRARITYVRTLNYHWIKSDWIYNGLWCTCAWLVSNVELANAWKQVWHFLLHISFTQHKRNGSEKCCLLYANTSMYYAIIAISYKGHDIQSHIICLSCLLEPALAHSNVKYSKHSGPFMRQSTMPFFVQIMTRHLSGTNHYLNQRWLIVNWTPRIKFQR